MAKLIVNDITIKKALVIDHNGEPLTNFPIELPDREEGEAKGTPIKSPAHLAGYVNSLMKSHYNREHVVPNGAVLVLYDDGNRVVGKFRWVVDPKKKDGGRSVKVITNKIFTEE